MPNWSYNTVSTDEKTMEKIKKDYTNEKGEFEFTFNKLIPMPEELNIESSSLGNMGLALIYRILDSNELAMIKEKEEFKDFYFPSDEELDSYKDMVIKAYLSTNIFNSISCFKEKVESLPQAQDINPKDYEKEFVLGRKYVENYMAHNHATWYTWSFKMWGTKWDASDSYLSGNSFSFNTAWCLPEPVIKKLSEAYPEAEFTFKYEVDNGIGQIIMQNGTVISSEFTEYNWDEDDEELIS